ncbi:hypothetical protein BJ684DRAFT_18380 [Piptocephalis cylindrospora]|uniref:Uncharacterized protein n=1 Tax=Piptocephalis cylindrospora TaxID=1907219 RepID=A0A4P9Y804_9FUNG|nr:hypothetical protein BJ684DRAFT_18380 [Piptocephalis cylindrospora]|eukprot:RKP15286.1 hypothetical protein BJ684DRAFT_18380 [Piptocephalis cylindrospora]
MDPDLAIPCIKSLRHHLAWRISMHIPLTHGSDAQVALAWRRALFSRSLIALLYLPDPQGFPLLELHQWIDRLLAPVLSSLPLSTRSYPSSSPSFLRYIRTLLPSPPTSPTLITLPTDRIHQVNGTLFGVLANYMMKYSTVDEAKRLLSHATHHHSSYIPPAMVRRQFGILEHSDTYPFGPSLKATPPWDLPSLHQAPSLSVRMRRPEILLDAETYARAHGLAGKGRLLEGWIIGWARLNESNRAIERWDEWYQGRGKAHTVEKDRLLAEVCLGWEEDWRGALLEVRRRSPGPDQGEWWAWPQTRLALVTMYLRSLRREEEWLSGIPPRASPSVSRDLLSAFLPPTIPLPLSKEKFTLSALWDLARPPVSPGYSIPMAMQAKYLRALVEWAGTVGLEWSWRHVGPWWIRQARSVQQRRWWWVQWARYAQNLQENEEAGGSLTKSTILANLRAEVSKVASIYNEEDGGEIMRALGMEKKEEEEEEKEGKLKEEGLGRRVFNALRLLAKVTSWGQPSFLRGDVEEGEGEVLGERVKPDEILDLYAHVLHLTARQARNRRGLILGVVQKTYGQLRGNPSLNQLPWSQNILLASGLARLHAKLGDARAVRALLDGHDRADRISESLLLLAHARAGDVTWLEGRMKRSEPRDGHLSLQQDPWAWSALLLAYRESPRPGLLQVWHRMEGALGVRRIREVGSGLLVRLALQAVEEGEFPELWERIRFLGLTNTGGAMEGLLGGR